GRPGWHSLARGRVNQSHHGTGMGDGQQLSVARKDDGTAILSSGFPRNPEAGLPGTELPKTVFFPRADYEPFAIRTKSDFGTVVGRQVLNGFPGLGVPDLDP